MVVYTVEQRWKLFRHYFENYDNVAKCIRKLRTDFERREAPSAPYKQGEAVTVNGNRYRAMLNEFLFTKIEDEDIGLIWFQQEGATCHTAEATLDVLRLVFEDRIIIIAFVEKLFMAILFTL